MEQDRRRSADDEDELYDPDYGMRRSRSRNRTPVCRSEIRQRRQDSCYVLLIRVPDHIRQDRHFCTA